MQVLIFYLGNDRYALVTDTIREILPMLELKGIPGAPSYVSGLMNYRGTPVPVIDLSAMALGRPSRDLLSTRILVVDYPWTKQEPGFIGIIAEKVLEVIREDQKGFVPSGVTVDKAPYLGLVKSRMDGMIQLIEIEDLLPLRVRQILYQKVRDEAGKARTPEQEEAPI